MLPLGEVRETVEKEILSGRVESWERRFVFSRLNYFVRLRNK